MRVSRVGSLRERVEIFAQSQTVDAAGSIVTTAWARMTPTNATGLTLAERDDAMRYYTMTLRYTADITTNSQVVWRSRKFDVSGVIDQTEQRQFLTVYLQEINA